VLLDDPIRTVVCPDCQAAGAVEFDGLHAYNRKICRRCHGHGKLPRNETATEVIEGPYTFLVKAGKPWAAHQKLSELFAELAGEARVCDPYCGPGTLERLSLLRHCSPIKFLTRNDEPNYHRLMKEFAQDHGTTEYRRNKGKSLHDRFVLTNESLILLGHGIKDVGQRDSFIVRLDNSFAQELIEEVRISFDQKWKAADVIMPT
jgi:hypothetical protein